jgi:hypothetical protein
VAGGSACGCTAGALASDELAGSAGAGSGEVWGVVEEDNG